MRTITKNIKGSFGIYREGEALNCKLYWPQNFYHSRKILSLRISVGLKSLGTFNNFDWLVLANSVQTFSPKNSNLRMGNLNFVYHDRGCTM